MSATPIETGLDAAVDVGVDVEPRPTRTVQVWDLPLRIFHWALVLSIAAAYVTAEFGGSEWVDWHGRIGAFVLGLLVFRLIWGFIGTQHARFSSFFPTPSRIAAYATGRWRGVGHNPLGALSVIALLLLVAAQLVTGLFANDDIAFAGPLSDWIAKNDSDRLTGWHQQLFYVLAGFIGLHLVAILFYLLVRRSNLVAPMITGKKAIAAGGASPTPERLIWRFAAAVIIAATVSWLTFRDSPSPQADAAAPPAATADW